MRPRPSLLSFLPLALALLSPATAGATPVTWVWTVTAGSVQDAGGTGVIASGDAFEIEVALDTATSLGTGVPSSLLYPASRFEIRLPGATLLGPEPGTGALQSLLLLVADGSASSFFGQTGDALAVVTGPATFGGTPFHLAGGGTGTLAGDLGVALLDASGQSLVGTAIPAPPPALAGLSDASSSLLAFSWTDAGGSHSVSLDDLHVTQLVAVPEPGALTLMALAAAVATPTLRGRHRRG